MDNGINPVAQTYFEVSDIQFKVATERIDYTKHTCTWLKSAMTADGMEPISLQDLECRVNSYQKPKDKKNSSGILKGLFTNGYSGENCTSSSPYLFFDIDVSNTDKKKENVHLLDPTNNDRIFEELEKMGVIVWRSNSQNGIAGIIYIPQIAEYLNDQKDLHKIVGTHITDYLSDYLHTITGIDKVKFDPAQSKFRQVRFLAQQHETRTLNPYPAEFTYKIEEKIKQTSSGVTKYRDKDFRQPTNSVFTQFDDTTPILDMMLKNGFSIVAENGNKTRVKHAMSESGTTGEVDKKLNVYFNYSQTFGGTTSFTPSRIVCRFEFDNDWKRFNKHLHTLNYKDRVTTQTELMNASSSLKDELKTVQNGDEDKLIFKHCFDLQNATNEIKYKFIEENCILPEYKKYFIEYLKLIDYTIKYDAKFSIEEYVSEVLPEILDYADIHKKIIVRAETGKGKTTAFVRDFHKHRPKARLLILAPLTIIVEQNAKDYKTKGAFLTGKSRMHEKIAALKAKIVFATYEQGIKLLSSSHTFDYIVIDEIHQLLTANSFKRDVIAELTPLLTNSKVIGLTGTPTQIFNQLNFKLLDVDVKNPIKTDIEVRYLNIKAYDIVMNHLSHKPQGKVLIRLNEIATINELIKHLVSTGLYKKSEILFLHSTKEIKNSKEYKRLAHKREFYGNYKVIFTTSIIDEGLSIDQAGFTDVIFIETNYHPRPEPIKQFFARFRNVESDRKNYLYLRTKENQTATHFKPERMFDNDLLKLENERSQIDAREVLTTYNSLFSNNNFYYNDATVNLYFLAYAATEVLFSYFNSVQFLDYLENNYNLSFTINQNFEVEKRKASFGNYTKELKQQIAKFWIEENPQILQVLHYHTQNPNIRKGTHPTQTRIEPEVLEFAISNIKHFETLFTRNNELIKLKVSRPVELLINHESDPMTLQSNDFYKKEVLFYRIGNTFKNPLTIADKKTAKQFLDFAKWCSGKKIFSSKQMMQQLKEIGVMNYKAFNEKMLFEFLKRFELNVTKNTKTKMIKCTAFEVVS